MYYPPAIFGFYASDELHLIPSHKELMSEKQNGFAFSKDAGNIRALELKWLFGIDEFGRDHYI